MPTAPEIMSGNSMEKQDAASTSGEREGKSSRKAGHGGGRREDTPTEAPTRLTDVTRSWKHGRNLVYFAATLVTTGLLVARLTEDSLSPIKPSIEYLESLCAEPPTGGHRNLIVLAGTSYARTDCDPGALESHLAARGYPGMNVVAVATPSFDILGTHRILKRVLEVPGIKQRLSLVVVDHSAVTQLGLGRFAGTIPNLWLLGDAAHVIASCKVILESGMPWKEKARLITERARHFAQANLQTGVIGSGLRLISGESLHEEPEDGKFSILPIEETGGHIALEGRGDLFRNVREDRWRERVERYARSRSSIPPMSQAEQSILRSSIELVLEDPELENAGAISVLYPSLWTEIREEHVSAALGGLANSRVSIADFSQPETYPEFFEIEYLYDRRHLNTRGAELFAEQLGEEILRLYGRNPELHAAAARK